MSVLSVFLFLSNQVLKAAGLIYLVNFVFILSEEKGVEKNGK